MEVVRKGTIDIDILPIPQGKFYGPSSYVDSDGKILRDLYHRDGDTITHHQYAPLRSSPQEDAVIKASGTIHKIQNGPVCINHPLLLFGIESASGGVKVVLRRGDFAHGYYYSIFNLPVTIVS